MPGIDAVTVSTPDHMHAPITLTALKLKKHCYTQKPLTHSVYEARVLTKAAAEAGVVTQMGTQHHATKRLKLAVQTIRDGVIGKVSEVHCWTDRPGTYWKQGLERRPRGKHLPPASTGMGSSECARTPVCGQAVSSVPLAGLVGLWNRRPRRYGMPHHGSNR